MNKVLTLVAVIGMIATIGCSDNKGSTKTSTTTTTSSAKAT
jgi:hypothetical protein